MLLLSVASGNFILGQLVKHMDTAAEGMWFKSPILRLICLLHTGTNTHINTHTHLCSIFVLANSAKTCLHTFWLTSALLLLEPILFLCLA